MIYQKGVNLILNQLRTIWDSDYFKRLTVRYFWLISRSTEKMPHAYILYT